MLTILYEDDQVLVAEKPVGIESQSARSFAPDMVSEIRKHINQLCTGRGEPYVGVIHRLDKPVSGVMVYAKTQKAAAALSRQLQSGELEKKYQAVLCGKLVDIVGNYVDYLLKDGKTNCSRIVDKGINGAKRAELDYRVLGESVWEDRPVTLVEIRLLTGRHHQIRVQFAGRGTPLWGDNKYNPLFQGAAVKADVALCASELSFLHPVSGERMSFTMKPRGEIFRLFG